MGPVGLDARCLGPSAGSRGRPQGRRQGAVGRHWHFGLTRFGRALRLRWHWHQWNDLDRPWVGSQLPCDQANTAFFLASTTITIDNGRTTLFWHDNWSGRGPLKELAPKLYKITTRKHRMVHTKLSGESWIKAVPRQHSVAQLGEFVGLSEWISQTQLLPNQEDSISWNLTANGVYSSASAYAAQFLGSHPRFVSQDLDRAFGAQMQILRIAHSPWQNSYG